MAKSGLQDMVYNFGEILDMQPGATEPDIYRAYEPSAFDHEDVKRSIIVRLIVLLIEWPICWDSNHIKKS